MELSEVTYPDAVPFEGYGPGFFRIGGQVHEGNVLAVSQSVRGWGGFDDSASVAALAAEIDVVLVGTGAETVHAPAAFRSALEAVGIGVEVMPTPSACRTYNVLLGEGRRVAAAVLAL
ncbi:Mth938-like domain-containing protein [Tropicimonas marinistellae]|uniref:Mth938-like domain-containing protein n=1 Tax=Tropicimonas marinistellae TaxID=1739787 RepID=UPI00082BE603|nr:Mth938-like domain-containing protein [Tropicimonas marinistellae]